MDKKDISALEENIKKKGELSYYYAHGRKFQHDPNSEEGKILTGAGLITGGDPELLKSDPNKKIDTSRKTKPITNYIFYDDDKFVVIKFDFPEEILENFEQKDHLEIELLEKSVEVKLDVPNKDLYKFAVKKLYKSIDVAGSSYRVRENKKIIIKLKKTDDTEEWSKLTA